jgi:hypothetical protein
VSILEVASLVPQPIRIQAQPKGEGNREMRLARGWSRLNPQSRELWNCRVAHLQELTEALQEQYPEAKMLGRARRWEAWRGSTSPGDIIATVSADGKSYPFDQS